MRDLQLIQPDTPSHLLQVALRHMDEFNPVRCAKDLLHSVPPMGGGQQVVFSAGGELNLCVGGVWKALPSLSILSLAGVLCLASLFFVVDRHEGASAGHCCGQFLMAVHVLPFCPDGAHGIQVAAHVLHHAEGAQHIFRSHQ